MPRRIHKDCPFTEEEILTFKAMLYQVNTANRCINPAPLCWVSGFQWWQNEKIQLKAMEQKIQVTGKNWTEIFNLPCVEYIEKTSCEVGGIRVGLYGELNPALAGDWLVEDDNGNWHVEKGGGQ